MIPILPLLGGLLGKIPFKVYAYGLAAAALSAILWAGWSHYTGLVQDRITQAANAARLESAIVQQGQAVKALERNKDKWKKSQRRLTQRMRELKRVTHKANEEKRRINELFAKHDLKKLAYAKPGLIEQRLNRGTARIARLLGCTTGSQDQCSTD